MEVSFSSFFSICKNVRRTCIPLRQPYVSIGVSCFECRCRLGLQHPYLVITVPADVLAPLGAMPSAYTLMTAQFYVTHVLYGIYLARDDLELPLLTHWGRLTYICVSNLTIIGSDNGLSHWSTPSQYQNQFNVGILLIPLLGANLSKTLIEIQIFWFKKCIWKCRLRNGVYFVLASMCWPHDVMGLLPHTQNCGLCMRRECRERFPRHHGLAIPTCIMARAWRTCRDACRDR